MYQFWMKKHDRATLFVNLLRFWTIVQRCSSMFDEKSRQYNGLCWFCSMLNDSTTIFIDFWWTNTIVQRFCRCFSNLSDGTTISIDFVSENQSPNLQKQLTSLRKTLVFGFTIFWMVRRGVWKIFKGFWRVGGGLSGLFEVLGGFRVVLGRRISSP